MDNDMQTVKGLLTASKGFHQSAVQHTCFPENRWGSCVGTGVLQTDK